MKILTFNTGLLELSVGKLSFDVVPFVEERAQLLPSYIKEADADIVCLQELFRVEDMEILKTLHEIYPHMYFSDQKNIFKRNGLAILSKHSFDVKREIKFKTRGLEKFVTKGAVKVMITGGEYKGTEVVNTHFPYGGFGSSSETLPSTIRMRNRNIKHLHKKIHSESKTTILAGDFNFGSRVAPENFHLIKSLGYQEISNGDVTWDVENPLNLMFPASVSKTIDHIFINKKRDYEFSVTNSIRVFDTAITINNNPAFLSDHFGLLCDIQL